MTEKMIKQRLRSAAIRLQQYRHDVAGMEHLVSWRIQELKGVGGITTKALATFLGVSPRFVYMLEKGERSWSDELLLKLESI